MKYGWAITQGTIRIKGKKTLTRWEKAIKKAKECLAHEFQYAFEHTSSEKTTYKRYRRGKNRCPRCGLKIK